jgi:hypothetical protein
MKSDKNIAIEHHVNFDNLNYFFGVFFPNQSINSLDFEKKMGVVYDHDMYKYNKYGFRSDEFNSDITKKHILFAGCSETEGIGNEFEDVWAKKLYEKIKLNENLDGYFNIGKAGLSCSMIIKNIFNYIKLFGKPETLFVIFPDHNRFLSWSIENENYTHLFLAANKDVAKKLFDKSKIYTKSEKEIDIKINQFYNELMITILNDFCKINNIKLYWSSWNRNCYEDFSKTYDIDGYLDIYNTDEYIKDAKISELKAKDHSHLGTAFHTMWAEIFYEKYINDKKN